MPAERPAFFCALMHCLVSVSCHNCSMHRAAFLCFGFAAITGFSAPQVSEKHANDMAKGLALFKSDVRVVLKQNCVKCHGGDKVRGDLDLSTRVGLLKGGEEGPAIVPGKAESSLLYQLITHAHKPHMPAKADKLPATSIKKIADWINLGAPYDKPLTAKSIAGKGMQVTDDDRITLII